MVAAPHILALHQLQRCRECRVHHSVRALIVGSKASSSIGGDVNRSAGGRSDGREAKNDRIVGDGADEEEARDQRDPPDQEGQVVVEGVRPRLLNRPREDGRDENRRDGARHAARRLANAVDRAQVAGRRGAANEEEARAETPRGAHHAEGDEDGHEGEAHRSVLEYVGIGDQHIRDDPNGARYAEELHWAAELVECRGEEEVCAHAWQPIDKDDEADRLRSHRQTAVAAPRDGP